MKIIKICGAATSCALSVLLLASACRTAMAQTKSTPAPPAPPAPEASDRQAAIAAVQAFFDTMAARDVAGAQRVLLPDAIFHYVVKKDGKSVVESFTTDWWLKALPQRKSAWYERIWNSEVRLRGTIATVWAPYDFWRNGVFDHCGVDACDVVKTDEGWRIAACMYTFETECEPSPLGPPKLEKK